MIITLKREQMLELWRLRRGFEPLRSDGQITRRDGLDIDELLIHEINDWYTDLLYHGPPEMVEITDIASMVTLTMANTTGKCSLPERCCRVVSVKAKNWLRSATPQQLSEVGVLDINEYAGRGPNNPLAIIEGRELTLYQVKDNRPERLLAVMRPETEGDYRFDDSALSTVVKFRSL